MRVDKAAYNGPDVATRAGPLRKYISRGGVYVVGLKGGWGSGRNSQAVRDNRALFARVSALMKQVDGDTYQWAVDQAKGTLYLPRDILAKLIYGTLYRYEMLDGTYKIGARMVANDIQKMLDGISQTKGSILIRTDDGWVSLEPGAANQVIAINPETGVPAWTNESASLPEAQAVLDAVGAFDGAMLFRSEAGWSAVPMGNTGQYLTIDPATGEPRWAGVVISEDQFSEILDGFSPEPGATIYRSNVGWQPLAPGAPGQFYVIDETTGLPCWKDYTGEDLQLQAALNGLSTTQGAVIFRGAGEWKALAPGADGDVLVSHGSTADPDWQAGGSGGGTAAEGIAAPVISPASSAVLIPMWSKTFEPGDLIPGRTRIRLTASMTFGTENGQLGPAITLDELHLAGWSKDMRLGDEKAKIIIDISVFDDMLAVSAEVYAVGADNKRDGSLDYHKIKIYQRDLSQPHTLVLNLWNNTGLPILAEMATLQNLTLERL